MSELRELSSRSGPDTLVTPLCRAPIDHPSAWKVADFKTPADYTIELSATQLQDIERVMGQMKAAGLGLDDLQREHFEVPSLRPVIDEIRREIEDGRGFVVVRRLPVEDYSKDEIGMIFWGIGTYLGRGLSQSVLGDRLGHVKDFSREDPLARAYRNKQELSPHTDSCDLVGLACLRDAKSGGVSRLTSALTVHNVMLEEYPEALERLYRGYTFHRRGEEKPGDLPYTPYRVPVYSNTEGKVSARYVRTYVEAGEAAAGRPMGEAELRVLDRFEEVTKRPELMLGIHAAARRDLLHQQLHDPPCAHRVRRRRYRGGPAAAPAAAVARSAANAARPSAHPERRH
jgi:Taurine catabolism dioxygenase TauD, TfdA family